MELSHAARIRILWIIMVLVAIIICYLVGFSYFTSLTQSKQHVLAKLKAVTCTASLHLDIAKHQKIVELFKLKDAIVRNDQDSNYALLQEDLLRIQKVNHLNSPVHTMVYDSSYHLFQFIGTSAEKPNFRHDYIHFPKKLFTDIKDGGTLDTYESENGTWLSAFAPLKTKSGKVVAILQADEEFSEFIDQANSTLLKNMTFALVVVLPLFFGLYQYTKNFLNQQEQNEEQLLKQQKAIVNQSNIIKKQSARLLQVNDQINLHNKELDRQVILKTAELNNTINELQTYLYRSSHDLRGPLSTLLGLCHLNLMEGDQKNEYSKMIFATSEKLAERIKSLTEVYEIKSKELILERINIGKFASDIIQQAIESDKSMKQAIVCYSYDSPKVVETDQYLLSLLIKEIIHNAAYHNHQTGDAAIKITVSVEETNQYMVLNFVDSGGGMPPEVQEKAFDMFYRGNEKSQGAGLGLYKVKMIAERLKAFVTLQSELTQGTKVSVCFANKQS